jgi:hypothetical protein
MSKPVASIAFYPHRYKKSGDGESESLPSMGG